MDFNSLRTMKSSVVYFYAGLVLYVAVMSKVSSEMVCGSEFSDVASRTVLASVVFRGTAQTIHNWTGPDNNQYYNATFKVSTLYKGSLPRRDNGSRGFRSVVVGLFGDAVDKKRCVSKKVTVGSPYIVFLNSTIHGKYKKLNIYRTTSFPELLQKEKGKEAMEIVKNYSCQKCGRPPKSKIQTQHHINATHGKTLQLDCSFGGKPTPRVRWSKDDKPISTKKGLKVTQNRHGSKLQINEVKEVDSGIYGCQAVNALGQSNWSTVLVSVLYKPHSVPCHNHVYCLNGGTCYMLSTLSLRYCHCTDGYIGERCELKKVDIDYRVPGPVVPGNNVFKMDLVMPVIGVALASVVLMFLSILFYFAIRSCCLHHQKKRKDNSESSYRGYSLEYQGSSLQSYKRKSKTGTLVMKEAYTQTGGSVSSSSEVENVRPDNFETQAQLNRPRHGSTQSNSSNSSQRRNRLNGISVTPPDFLDRRHRIRSPIAEVASVASDGTEELDEAKPASEETPLNDTNRDVQTSICIRPDRHSRISKYDNYLPESVVAEHDTPPPPLDDSQTEIRHNHSSSRQKTACVDLQSSKTFELDSIV